MKPFKFVGIFLCAALLTACGHDTGLEMPDANSENYSSETAAENCVPEFLEDVTWDRVRLMSAAIAPYTMEVPEDQIPTVSDALLSAEWEEIDADTPIPDGESYSAFVYNSSSPFRLVFYADYTADFDNGDSQRKYRVSSEAFEAVVNTVNCDNVYDYLIWNEAENITPEGVWLSDSPYPDETETEEAEQTYTINEIPENAAYKITEFVYDENGELTEENVNFYNSNNDPLIEFSKKNEDGSFQYKTEYEYNEDGTLAVDIMHLNISEIKHINEYTDGLPSFISTYIDGELFDESIIVSDEYGNPISSHSTISDCDCDYEYINEYDDNGNLTRTKWHTVDSEFNIGFDTKMEYDENNNMISSTTGKMKDVFEYDENNHIIRRDTYKEGEFNGHSEMEYEFYE